MDHRIPRVGVVISIVLAIGALITFVYLNNRFQGPNPVGFLADPYELTARFKDNKTLPTKQPVLYKGIEVGTITGVEWDAPRRESIVTFSLADNFRLRRDAVIRIGARSLLGDPYLAVDSRGSEDRPELKSGDEVAQTETTVDFDEALSFLDEEGRRHVKSLIRTVADGTARPGNGERLNATLTGVSRTVSELRTLTGTLRGQEQQIADLVASAGTVLTTIGDREQSIRTIVSSGRTTLDALASNTGALERGMDELPLLLDSATGSLAEVRPLLSEIQPAFTKLRAVAPSLAAALDPQAPAPLGESVEHVIAIARGLGPLSRQAEPVLSDLKALLDDLVAVVRAGGPGARNLLPALTYLTPRAGAVATGYSLLAATLSATDASGNYARLALSLDGQSDPPPRGGRNAYPGPNDALDPQPFQPPYPRIVPCNVPPRTTPTAPCR